MTRSASSNAYFVICNTVKYNNHLFPVMILAAFVQSINLLVFPLVSKLIIGVAEKGGAIEELTKIAVPIVVGAILLSLLGSFADNSIERQVEHVRAKFTEKRVRKSFEIDYCMLEKAEILDLQRKASESDSSGNSGIVGILSSFRSLFANLISFIMAAVIICGYNYIVIICMVVVCIIRIFLINSAKRYDKKYVWDMMAPFWRRIDYLYYSAIGSEFAKDIRLYRMEKWMSDKHVEVSNQAHELICKSKMNWLRFTTVNQVLVFISDLILYGWLIVSSLHGDIRIADFMLCYGAVYAFVESTNRFFENIIEIKQYSLQIDDYRDFLELPLSSDKKICKPIPECSKFMLSLQNVSFKYPGQDKYALQSITLNIPVGQKLAIVGINGAGKSTLVNLLMRLYEPTEGSILLNGVDIRNYDKTEYYRLFSPVFQNSEPIAFSLYENVSMSSILYTDKCKVDECLKKAGLSEKIDTLPHGAGEVLVKGIYDEGIDFSGGERQKLMLARALYKNAPIIILDEPTAALDALAESELYEHFHQFTKNNTTIYISHRLSSTKFCDAIVMMDDGKVVEYGTHNELMAKRGRYADLFEVQAQYYRK